MDFNRDIKHIRRFNNFVRVNEEFIGLGMVALAGLSLAGVLIGYDSDSTKRPDPVDMLYLKDYEEIRKEYAPRYKGIVRGTIG